MLDYIYCVSFYSDKTPSQTKLYHDIVIHDTIIEVISQVIFQTAIIKPFGFLVNVRKQNKKIDFCHHIIVRWKFWQQSLSLHLISKAIFTSLRNEWPFKLAFSIVSWGLKSQEWSDLSTSWHRMILDLPQGDNIKIFEICVWFHISNCNFLHLRCNFKKLIYNYGTF